MTIPASLQSAIDRMAATRAKMGRKGTVLSPLPPQETVKTPKSFETRAFRRLERPVSIQDGIRHWWADPEK